MKVLAEQGRVDFFEDEIGESVDDGDAYAFFETSERRFAPTVETKLDFTTTRGFPLVTMATKINPSPDWFTGLSGVDLRPNGEWEREIAVDLYAWDAGTEEGTEFDRENTATNPAGVVTSLRNSGKFSDSPIARVTFRFIEPGQVEDVTAVPGEGEIEVSWTKVEAATGYRVQWKSGSEGFADAAGAGRESVIGDGETNTHTIPNLTNGVEYTIRVIATNPAGDGIPSAEVDATPVDPLVDEVLVSNVSQNAALTAQLSVSAEEHRYLQGFTTGDRVATIGSITLSNLRGVAAGSMVSLSIFSDNGGALGSRLHTLSAPETLTTRVDAAFAAPEGSGVTLAANTSYYIQVEHAVGSLSMTVTKADAEDPQSDPGWSIADVCQFERASEGRYLNCPFSKALSLSVNGPSSTASPLLSIADAAATEGSNVEFTVTLSKPAAAVTVQYDTGDGTATEDGGRERHGRCGLHRGQWPDAHLHGGRNRANHQRGHRRRHG